MPNTNSVIINDEAVIRLKYGGIQCFSLEWCNKRGVDYSNFERINSNLTHVRILKMLICGNITFEDLSTLNV